MATIPIKLSLPERENIVTTTTASMTLAARYCCGVFTIPYTGLLKYVGFTVTVSTTPADMSVRIETVNSATGAPSGTLAYANASGTITVSAANAVYWCPINGSDGVTVTAGDLVAVRINLVADNPSGPTIQIGSTWQQPGTAEFPYAGVYTTVFTGYAVPPAIALEYTDRLMVPSGCSMPCYEGAAGVTGTATMGVRFQVPVTCNCIGVWGLMNTVNTGFIMKIYGPDGATVVAQTPTCVNTTSSTTVTNGVWSVALTSPITLYKGYTYRLVFFAADPSKSVSTVRHQFTNSPNFDARTALQFGTAMEYTSASVVVDESSWTQDATRRVAIGIVVDTMEIPTGYNVGFVNGGFS